MSKQQGWELGQNRSVFHPNAFTGYDGSISFSLHAMGRDISHKISLPKDPSSLVLNTPGKWLVQARCFLYNCTFYCVCVCVCVKQMIRSSFWQVQSWRVVPSGNHSIIPYTGHLLDLWNDIFAPQQISYTFEISVSVLIRPSNCREFLIHTINSIWLIFRMN